MADAIPTRAQLETLEHHEREALLLSAVDARLADLNRLKRIASKAGGRTNRPGTILALRASLRRLIARAEEFDIRLTVERAT